MTYLAEELKGSIAVINIYMQDFDYRRADPLTDTQVRNHRQTITNFHQATYIFWSIFVKKEGKDLLSAPVEVSQRQFDTDRPPAL